MATSHRSDAVTMSSQPPDPQLKNWQLWVLILGGLTAGIWLGLEAGSAEKLTDRIDPRFATASAVVAAIYLALSAWEKQLREDDALRRWRYVRTCVDLAVPMSAAGAAMTVAIQTATKSNDVCYYAGVSVVGLVLAVVGFVLIRLKIAVAQTPVAESPNSLPNAGDTTRPVG